MKKAIHPKYYNDCQVTCACGNSFTTGSTLQEIKVEICASCHPFFTGEQKFIDTMGKLERFKQKQVQANKQKYVKKSDREAAKLRLEQKQLENKPKTLKEMLEKK